MRRRTLAVGVRSSSAGCLAGVGRIGSKGVCMMSRRGWRWGQGCRSGGMLAGLAVVGLFRRIDRCTLYMA